MKIILFVLFTVFGTVSGEPLTGSDRGNVVSTSGKATYYHSKFQGRRTSSGEIFSNKKFTAAHLTLPFGTIVTVTNPVNGKSVDVKVNDRGPHSKKLIIDLSQAAAREIGILGKGIAEVELSYVLPQ